MLKMLPRFFDVASRRLPLAVSRNIPFLIEHNKWRLQEVEKNMARQKKIIDGCYEHDNSKGLSFFNMSASRFCIGAEMELGRLEEEQEVLKKLIP